MRKPFPHFGQRHFSRPQQRAAAMEPRRTAFGLRFAITLLLVAIVSYFWGGVTVYWEIFPYFQIQLLKTKYFGRSPTSAPRIMMFQTFSPKSDIVMVGDSLTAEAPWNEIFPNVQIANRGIVGDTTDSILLRMDTILSVSPDKALIMVGINDIRRGASLDSIFQNYREIVRRLQQAGISVIIQSTLECSKTRCGDLIYQVRELNKYLKDLAGRNDIEFVDIDAELSSTTDGLLAKYTSDGIHLLASGYVKWSEKIRPYIYPAN
jgi:lysophospholipase L1-like esterase